VENDVLDMVPKIFGSISVKEGLKKMAFIIMDEVIDIQKDIEAGLETPEMKVTEIPIHSLALYLYNKGYRKPKK